MFLYSFFSHEEMSSYSNSSNVFLLLIWNVKSKATTRKTRNYFSVTPSQIKRRLTRHDVLVTSYSSLRSLKILTLHDVLFIMHSSRSTHQDIICNMLFSVCKNDYTRRDSTCLDPGNMLRNGNPVRFSCRGHFVFS